MKKAISLLLSLVMILAVMPLAQVESNAFTVRTTMPSTSNQYYFSSNNPFYPNYGLPNCTCYAWGRAYEVLGYRPNLSTNNAKTFYTYNQNNGVYAYGTTPVAGSIACWTGEYGHVAFVESVNNDGTINISESNWSDDRSLTSSTAFRYLTNINPYAYYSSLLSFQGYIYVCGTPVPTTGIAFNCGEMTLTIGQTYCFTVTVYPSNATDKSVTYSSSDTSVATVDKNGYVKGISAGTAYITARASGGQTATRKVTIASSAVATTGILYNHTDMTIDVGGQAFFKVTIYPSDATDKTVTWSSSDTSVATVDSNGVVRGVSTGTAVITARASGGQTATRFIVVFPADSAVPVCVQSYNGHTYALYDYATSWTDAKAFCEAKGGYLATITSQSENAFIFELMKNGTKDRYLIGATDSETEGVWKWVSGEPFEYSFFSSSEDVNNPLRESEDWLFVNNQSLWGDMTNYGNPANHGFICEYDTADDSDDWEYDIVNGSLVITGYNGSASELIIPDSISGYPVTAIDEAAFVRCTSLESVTLPQGVTSIGSYAFSRCSNLNSITIPASVNEIGDGAFNNCSSFGTIYGYTGSYAEDYASENNYSFVSLNAEPESNFGYSEHSTTSTEGIVDRYIQIYSYNGESEDLIIPSTINGITVRQIDETAFTRCTSIKTIVLPNHLEEIGDYAFSRCTNLESITIPASVTSIGNNIFSNCPSLKTVYGYLDSAAQEYAEVNDLNFVYLDKIVSGDMNNDGECDIADYAMLKSYISSSDAQFTNYQKISTDIDVDGACDAFDLFYINKITNHLM